MHFGLGGRRCIGKTITTTNIYKLTSSLLRDFEFEWQTNPKGGIWQAGRFAAGYLSWSVLASAT